MRVGIDTYSYHRFFGEIRDGESDPGIRWTTWNFLDRSIELAVDGVSLETCYLNLDEPGFVPRLTERLDEAGLERILAWGHPGGLEVGKSEAKVEDLLRTLDHAETIESSLMRIVLGTYTHWQQEPEPDSIQRLVPIIRDLCREAAERGIALAIETHCVISVDGLRELIERVGSDNLGVVLDTANVVRVGSDLVEATKRLAPYTRMLHIKDLDLAEASFGNPGGWWPCVPLGQGDLDLTSALDVLREANFDALACVEMATLPEGIDEDTAVADGVVWLRNYAKAA